MECVRYLVNDDPALGVGGDYDPELFDGTELVGHKPVGHSIHHFEASNHVIAVFRGLQVLGCALDSTDRQYLDSGVDQSVLWMFRIGGPNEIPVDWIRGLNGSTKEKTN